MFSGLCCPHSRSPRPGLVRTCAWSVKGTNRSINQTPTQTSLWPSWHGSLLEWGPIVRKEASRAAVPAAVRASQPVCLRGILPQVRSRWPRAPGSLGLRVLSRPGPHLLARFPELDWETGVCRLETGGAQPGFGTLGLAPAPGEAEKRKFLSRVPEPLTNSIWETLPKSSFFL